MVDMRLNLLVISIFCVGLISTFTIREETPSPRAIQFAHSANHKFQYELDDLKSVLLADNIKDRQIVIVSVAGAFRKGKSFLLNFFLRYLYARYQKHDVSDWIGEENNTKLTGFAWRGGRNRTTSGIVIWSDIFTHDYENGDKVAVILLDTQGTFDRQSSLLESTTIFALSTLLSSVQCYNIMQNIQEDDLQHLELFVEYSRLASEQSDEKPFQHLLFIVRDWQNQFEVDYGWNGQQVIDEVLAEHPTYQTTDMRQLRQRIRSSFVNITAFLLPYPGSIVATGRFTGDIKELDSDFKTYLKVLVPSLLAPENLVVKTINGQKIRACEMVQYIEQYTKLFNGEYLPEPKTLLQATAEVNNMLLYNQSLHEYLNVMDGHFGNDIADGTYYRNISTIHQHAKDKAIEQFQSQRKLGSIELIAKFQHALSNEINLKFEKFETINEKVRSAHVEEAKYYNDRLVNNIDHYYRTNMYAMANGISEYNFNEHSDRLRNSAMKEFDALKMGDDLDNDLSARFRIKLKQNLDTSFLIVRSSNENKRRENQTPCKVGGGAAAGAGVGAIFGGPVGAGIGFIYGIS
ncbi:atlastin-like [Bradysia coprophila]|uniref:atlastin-like n=1 Tax=Bradysia coprophila TaxID=38358 RepID=UPI00187DC103|nr:atlastin-like [Bradysia coprophila]